MIKLKRRTFIFLCLVSLIHEFGGNEEFKFGNIINTINVGLFLLFFFSFSFFSNDIGFIETEIAVISHLVI